MHLGKTEFRTSSAGRGLIACTIAVITLIICVVLAIGWTVHCNKLKDVNEKLAVANEGLKDANHSLRGEAAALEGRLLALAASISELTAGNRMLADANEKLAAELGRMREGTETAKTENVQLIEQITELYEDALRLTAESGKRVEELAQAVVSLSGDLSAANSRLDGLVAQLQAKTEEAAEQAIRINTLVEMVARLRVTAGMAERPEVISPGAEHSLPADPNSNSSKPPA